MRISILLALTFVMYANHGIATSNIVTVSAFLNESMTIEGTAAESIGKDVASNEKQGINLQPTIAMAGNWGMRVFYAGTNLSTERQEFTLSNSYLYNSGDYLGSPFVDFVNDYSGTNDFALTYGPYFISNAITLGQGIAIHALRPWEAVTNYWELNSTNGFIIVGTTEYPGIAGLNACIDMNEDGFNEIASLVGSGTKYYLCVWYGASNAQYVHNNVDAVNGTNDIAIKDIGLLPGQAIFTSGEFNNDGRGDIAVNTSAGLALVWGRQRYVKELCATNLAPEDGVIVKNAVIDKNGGFGDVNGDGIDDLILRAGAIVYGRTNWGSAPDAATMGVGEIARPAGAMFYNYPTAVIGDINGDGYDDWALQARSVMGFSPTVETNKTLVVYGRPVYPTSLDVWQMNGSNGFAILNPAFDEFPGWVLNEDPIRSFTRGGDWNSDGYEEAVFGMPYYSVAPYTNGGGVVCIVPGGPSPAWSPYIFAPTLVMEG